MAEDIADPQPRVGLEWAALASYLRDELPRADGFARRFGRGPLPELTVAQFPGGYSNLTYRLRFGDIPLVLRRPPIGPVPVRAHDMAREYRWLEGLHPVFPLAPEPFLLCDDPSVIGSVFYVMECREGLVIRAEEPAALRQRPDLRRRVGEALVDTLADLHAVDVSTAPLSRLGKPGGFIARQVRGWTERWHHAATSALPEMDGLAHWLSRHEPPDVAPAVVHGDFKLDNVLLDPHELTRLVAVLDWEMCALGDPLVDVGMLVVYWVHAAASGARDSWATVTGRPGWLGRSELLDRYGAATTRDLSHMGFYERLALFKLAVILQQLYVRHARGQSDDARLAHLGERVADLARYAVSLDG